MTKLKNAAQTITLTSIIDIVCQDEIFSDDVAPSAVPSRPKIKAAESAASAPTQIAPQLILQATHVSGREYRSSSRIMLSSAQNSAILAQN
jgi:hypothetical protein